MTDYDTDDETIADEKAAACYWVSEIKRAQKEFQKYQELCDKIAKRYRDERDMNKENSRRFNILWSNIQTMKPACYARSPKPIIERRFLERNDLERVAGMALQRAVTVEIETGGFEEAVGGKQGAVMDWLLFGRGQAWLRYEADLEEEDSAEQLTDHPEGHDEEVEQSETKLPKVTAERICIDYVGRKDFLHDPARTWPEVRWVGKRSWLSKRQTRDKFGKEIADKVVYRAIQTDDEDADRYGDQRRPREQRAEFWEIWDKIRRKIWVISPDYDEKPCKVSDDPLRLKHFWPCPKPLYGTLTGDTLVPVPDWTEYKSQAEELDILSERISKITSAIKAVGFYDASQPDLGMLFNFGTDNKMIPCETWAVLKDRGGLQGSVDFFPLEMLIKTLETLQTVFDQSLQRLYEVTGIADIIRGNSSPEETYGAQRIKGQFATLRLQERQREVATFCRDIVALMAELIAEHFSPETIAAMTGLADQSSPDAQMFQQAMQLVSDARMRSFRVDIETNSTIEVDIQADKEATVEFVNGVAQYFNQIMPAAEKMPTLIPLAGNVLLWAIRRFRTGRELESVFERAVDDFTRMAASGQLNPQAQPNPEVMKIQQQQQQMQADMQIEQMKEQNDQRQEQAQMQFEFFKHRNEMEMQAKQHQDEMELKRMELSAKMELEHKKLAHDTSLKQQDRQHETALKQQDREHNTAIEGTKIASQNDLENKKMAHQGAIEDKKMAQQEKQHSASMKSNESVAKIRANPGKESQDQINPTLEALHKAIAELAKAHSAPIEILRGKDGKATGARRVTH